MSDESARRLLRQFLDRRLGVVLDRHAAVERPEILAHEPHPAAIEPGGSANHQGPARRGQRLECQPQRLERAGLDVGDSSLARQQRFADRAPLDQPEQQRRAAERDALANDELHRRCPKGHHEIETAVSVFLREQFAKAALVLFAGETAGVDGLDVEIDGGREAGSDRVVEGVNEDPLAGKIW